MIVPTVDAVWGRTGANLLPMLWLSAGMLAVGMMCIRRRRTN